MVHVRKREMKCGGCSISAAQLAAEPKTSYRAPDGRKLGVDSDREIAHSGEMQPAANDDDVSCSKIN